MMTFVDRCGLFTRKGACVLVYGKEEEEEEEEAVVEARGMSLEIRRGR